MRGGLCDKLHGRRRRCCSHCSSHRSDSQIFVENRNFCLPHLHSTHPLGESPSECCHNVWCGKTRMVWLPDGEENVEDMFIPFERIHERDRHLDGRTDGQTPDDGVGRVCIASRGKNTCERKFHTKQLTKC